MSLVTEIWIQMVLLEMDQFDAIQRLFPLFVKLLWKKLSSEFTTRDLFSCSRMQSACGCFWSKTKTWKALHKFQKLAVHWAFPPLPLPIIRKEYLMGLAIYLLHQSINIDRHWQHLHLDSYTSQLTPNMHDRIREMGMTNMTYSNKYKHQMFSNMRRMLRAPVKIMTQIVCW
jgi:hypothetical protein